MVSAAQLSYLLRHPTQAKPIVQWLLWHKPVHRRQPDRECETLQRCFYWLEKTSRSFSAVIQELTPELLVPVQLFYLILRGLDTIEDDMTIPLDRKEPLLRNFADILDKDGWTFDGCGPNEKDRGLLVEFDVVITEFNKIKPAYRRIIIERTRAMGNGMADYAINAEHNVNGVDTLKDYDLYCYHVAGLVGHGLTDLFVESGLASPNLHDQPKLATSMGLCLQKTNIIRDFREDYDDKKRWYPKEIWSKHVKSIDNLAQPDHLSQALDCTSELVLDALQHIEDCILYMSAIKEQSVFNFVAIPQGMAIATLDEIYRNPRVFTQNVKITKGDACQLMMDCSQDLRSLCKVYRRHVRRIHARTSPSDPNFAELCIRCGQIEQYIEDIFPSQTAESARAKLTGARASNNDPPFLVGTVIGSLLIVALFMVRLAYLAGAKLDLMQEGKILPSFGRSAGAIIQNQPHVEL